MGVPGQATVTAAQYQDYIASRAWRATRERYWSSKLPQTCYVCGASRSPGMHLHHRTYKNLGNERLMDLVPVCPTCHELIHLIHRTESKYARGGLWAATKEARRRVEREQQRRRP